MRYLRKWIAIALCTELACQVDLGSEIGWEWLATGLELASRP